MTTSPAPRTDPPVDRPNRTGTRETTPLVTALNQEWARQRDQPTSDQLVRQWAQAEHALTGARCLRDVEALAGATAGDTVLAALLRLAQTGDRLATRTVLQLQLGAMIRLADRTRHHCGGDVGESVSRAVAHLWETIATYPVERRRGHAAGLALEVLSRLTARTDHRPGRRPRQPALVEVPHEDLLSTLAQRPDPAVPPDATREVLELLTWAQHRAVLTDEELQLLRRLHVTGEVDQAVLARELGITHAALRQRASRATRRLADAVRRSRTLTAAAPATTAPRAA